MNVLRVMVTWFWCVVRRHPVVEFTMINVRVRVCMCGHVIQKEMIES